MTSVIFLDFLSLFPEIYVRKIRKIGVFLTPPPPSVWTSYVYSPLVTVNKKNPTRLHITDWPQSNLKSRKFRHRIRFLESAKTKLASQSVQFEGGKKWTNIKDRGGKKRQVLGPQDM